MLSFHAIIYLFIYVCSFSSQHNLFIIYLFIYLFIYLARSKSVF